MENATFSIRSIVEFRIRRASLMVRFSLSSNFNILTTIADALSIRSISVIILFLSGLGISRKNPLVPFLFSVNLTARQSGFLGNRMSAAKFTGDIVTD